MLFVPELPPTTETTAQVERTDAAGDILWAGWKALALDPEEPNAFAEPWFLRPALAHLRNGTEVKLLTVRSDADGLIGLMPVTILPRYGRMPVAHVGNWRDFQCFMGTPLVRRGLAMSFWGAILRLLDRADWASGFLSVSGLLENGPVHLGLCEAAARMGRNAAVVHRAHRAALQSRMAPEDYLRNRVGGKRLKEFRRLARRLGEQGELVFSRLGADESVVPWCEAFIALEGGGWKGREGAAFIRSEGMQTFLRDMLSGAHAEGRLDFQRIDLDGNPVAMLVNFVTPPGSWSFKIAYDERFARFSPGVMIEIENLRCVLRNPEIAWMDSCAAPDHPMINGLWAERRTLVQVTVPLEGIRRRAVHAACRVVETGSALYRRARTS